MTDAELDELVRRNYTDANKSYLMEQKRIAERIAQIKDNERPIGRTRKEK